jgi:hypothetical protein
VPVDSPIPWNQPCGYPYAPFALMDAKTGTLSSLPARAARSQFISASGDGHWLLFVSPGDGTESRQATDLDMFLVDWTSGTTAAMDASGPGRPIDSSEWRPGRAELWYDFSYLVGGGLFGLWKAESGFDTAKGVPVIATEMPDLRKSMFTRDGKYWFSWHASRMVHVGLADDPAAPTFPIHPDGTLVDLAARTSRSLMSGGHLVALGQTRALAILDWETSRLAGNLVLVDLATGEQTLLSENVYEVTVDPGQRADGSADADRLSPGTRVAFLTRSRLESPYDGLWVATLP